LISRRYQRRPFFAYNRGPTCTVGADTAGGSASLPRTARNRLWFDGGTEFGKTGWVTNGVMMAEDVRAEIVASVLEVVVHEGDQIGEGDTLVLLESMKMEIPVLAEVAGTVSKVSVSVGDVIQAGDLIAVIS
jgi:acetyl-CoA carboxylase biotin carboxyl carrier protein